MKNKNLEIKGLFFDSFMELFDETIEHTITELKLTDEQITKKLEPKLEKLFESYEESIADIYFKNNKFNLNKFLKTGQQNQKVIVEENKRSFNYYLLYVNSSVLIYNKILEFIRDKKLNTFVSTNLILYGLVIRRAQEITELLINGYIDGAMIIWRSLYEYSVTLMLLAIEDNEELSRKFSQHSMKSSIKKAKSYNEVHEELKFPKLPDETDEIIEEEKEKLKAEYGESFLKNDYGWADDLFPGNQKANFRLLEEKIDFGRFRPYYLLCCEHIHSNFNGFINFKENGKIILDKLTNPEIRSSSFIDPMQFTVSILDEINDYILYEFSDDDEFRVNKLLLLKAFQALQDSYKSDEECIEEK